MSVAGLASLGWPLGSTDLLGLALMVDWPAWVGRYGRLALMINWYLRSTDVRLDWPLRSTGFRPIWSPSLCRRLASYGLWAFRSTGLLMGWPLRRTRRYGRLARTVDWPLRIALSTWVGPLVDRRSWVCPCGRLARMIAWRCDDRSGRLASLG